MNSKVRVAGLATTDSAVTTLVPLRLSVLRKKRFGSCSCYSLTGPGYLVIPEFAGQDETSRLKERAKQIVADFEPSNVTVFSSKSQASTDYCKGQHTCLILMLL